MRDLISQYPTTLLAVSALAIVAAVVLAGYAVRLLLAQRDSPAVVAEVVHVGATERWSPLATVESVPDRPLDPEQAAIADANAQLHTELDTIEHHFREQLARLCQEDMPTGEWTREELREVLGRAGR